MTTTVEPRTPGEIGSATSLPPAPQPDAAGWRHLPQAARLAWHVDNVLGLAILAAIVTTLAVVGRPVLLQPWLGPVAGLGVCVAVLESTFLIPRRHASYRYRLEADAVVVQSGLLVRRDLVVPLRQILYLEVQQGPVLRALGLARLRLGTIAEPKDVGPLRRTDALALRAALDAERTHDDQPAS